MPAVYDSWDRLVKATLRREAYREMALRTPSDLSFASSSSSFNLGSGRSRASSMSSRSLLVGESFTYPQILEATDGFSDSKLIKHGSSGDIYHGVLPSGIEIAVKKVNASSLEKELLLMSELEIRGMVNHSRLIPQLGHCLENADENFLVYKYMPNKDLSTYMSRNYIGWATRLKIAAQIAEGLCYLHHECSPPLVHRDVQTSSILLDDDFEVHLGSLSRTCVERNSDTLNRIARLRLQMSSDPEQSTAGNTACAYDVHCFGTVLLELVTGKFGLSAAKGSAMNVRMARTLSMIVSDDKKLIENIIDPSLIMDEDMLVELWAVAFIAKACLSPEATHRPMTVEIVKALEHKNLATLYGIADGKTTPQNYKLLVQMAANGRGTEPVVLDDIIKCWKSGQGGGAKSSSQRRRSARSAPPPVKSSFNSLTCWSLMRQSRYVVTFMGNMLIS